MIQIDVTLTLGSFRLAPKLQVGPGITVLFGQSGAGKTLTLEAVAGLLTPDRGRITIHGCPVFDSAAGLNVPPYDRRLGYVVQSYALFPHLTVAQNVAYGVFDLPRAERDRRVDGLLRTLGIDDLADRRPSQISGGQAQRTALARALVRRPQALLLDEPFAALDAGVALTLRRELRRLVRDLNLPVLMVTHDLTEASHIGDRIAVMDEGQVLQVGDRSDVLQRPRSARVARLLGIANVLEGEAVASDSGVRVHTPIGPLQTAQSRHHRRHSPNRPPRRPDNPHPPRPPPTTVPTPLTSKSWTKPTSATPAPSTHAYPMQLRPPRPPSRSKSPPTPTRSWASPPAATGASTSHPKPST